MKTSTLLFLSVLLITLSCSSPRVRREKHTPKEDVYWNDLAHKSLEGRVPLLITLEDNNPGLAAQIIKDSKDPYVAMFWGKSLNFDSGAKKKIVEDKIIADLQSVFSIKNDNMIVHAGIMHTYGYLFSTIDTPYGYKRKRWISPALNDAFSLAGNSFSPEAVEGGLLSNVTYFAGTLAFNNTSELSLLKNVSNEVFTYDYSKLSVERVEEITKDYTLVTTLVAFPTKPKNDDNEYLLIYSTINKLTNQELLVTAFPINAEAYKKIVDKSELGLNKKITLRYNAYLENTEKNLTGTRKLTKK